MSRREAPDARVSVVSAALGIPIEEATVQYGLVSDLLYAWDKSLTKSIFIKDEDTYEIYPAGVLLQDALTQFRAKHG